MGDREEWYWDLSRKMAVRASERGRSDQMMGPYESRAEAENWQQKVAARNESWDDADEKWSGQESSGQESSDEA